MPENVSIINGSLSISMNASTAVSAVGSLISKDVLNSVMGWDDVQANVLAAESLDQEAKYQLQQAQKAYALSHDDFTRLQFIAQLEKALDATESRVQDFQDKKATHQKLVKKEAKRVGSGSVVRRLGRWAMGGVKTFFGSTEEQLVEKYERAVQKEQRLMDSLNRALNQLHRESEVEAETAPDSSAQASVEKINTPADGISKFSSPAGRKLLSQNAPIRIYPSEINLSNLGGLGLRIDGETTGVKSGTSVSGAGDLNKDGKADVIIGSPGSAPGGISAAGSNHVIFGSASLSSIFQISLSSLMSSTGFQFNGDPITVGNSGISVSNIGDVNNDGVDDVIIGAHGGGGQAGRAHVIFGSTNVGNSGVIEGSTLDGSDGFVIHGEVVGDQCGSTVSHAGDFNNDGIKDFIIGARDASPYGKTRAGSAYVVYGGPNVGVGGVINLISLNGTNGFKIYGESAGDRVGFSLGAGDVNGDNITDVLIGADLASFNGKSQLGRVYVILGGVNVGAGGVMNLTSLDGTNGFKINGEFASDQSGSSVNAVDLNRDNLSDIFIGARGAKSYAGATHVVFGSANIGASGEIELSDLDGSNGFKINGEFVSDQSGSSVSDAGDVNGDGFQDLVIGAPQAKPNGQNSEGRVYVIYGGLNVGAGGVMNLTALNGTNGIKLNGVSRSLSGSSVSAAGDVNADGKDDVIIGAPGAMTSTGSSYVLLGGSAAFGGETFELTMNQLIILEGSNITLTQNDLNIVSTQLGFSFSIQNLEHGQFELTSNPGMEITTLQPTQIANGEVKFFHDGGELPPRFDVDVTHSTFVFPSTFPSNVTFINVNDAPILQNNQLTINEGETIVLGSNNLSASDEDNPSSSLEFIITNIQNGQFELVSNPGGPITRFTQQQITNSEIQFVHDGGELAPTYYIQVTDGLTTTSAQNSAVNFVNNQDDPPTIANNALTITQGGTVTLVSANLQAVDDNSSPAQLTFTVVQVNGGQFELVSNPGVAITSFTQQMIDTSQVQFAQDGSNTTPSYQLIVNDGALSSSPQAGTVNFTPTSSTTTSGGDDKIKNAIIGSVVSGTFGLGFLFLKLYISRRAAKSLKKAYEVEGGESDAIQKQRAFMKNVVKPIADELFSHINIKGFLGYIGENEMKAYIQAIRKIAELLNDQGVSLDFDNMSPFELNKLLAAVTEKTREQAVISASSCCSFFSRRCSPEATPDALRKSAKNIAVSVASVEGVIKKSIEAPEASHKKKSRKEKSHKKSKHKRERSEEKIELVMAEPADDELHTPPSTPPSMGRG